MLPSWAAVLSAAHPVPQPTARRAPPQTPLVHCPRKEQRREPATTSSAASSPPTAAHRVAHNAPPAAWEAHIAAFEARLNGVQALCDSLRDVPRMLASIQQKLDLQLGSNSSPSLPLPSQQRRTAPVQDRAPAAHDSYWTFASAPAFAELDRWIDAQESLLHRISEQLGQLARCVRGTTYQVQGCPLRLRLPTSANESPPLVALPDCEQCDSFPSHWLRALPAPLRPQVRRVPVKGDVSCADGAIVQAVEQSDYLDSLPLSQCLRPHARSTATFRQREVGAAMAEWTADDWASKMPALCRDEGWHEYRRAAGGDEDPVRSPAGELAFFRHVLGLPTCSASPRRQ